MFCFCEKLKTSRYIILRIIFILVLKYMDAIVVILVSTILGFPQSRVFGEAASQFILVTRDLFTTAVEQGTSRRSSRALSSLI